LTAQGAAVFWTALNPALKEMETRNCFGGNFVLLWYKTLI
jgi:hypothetical protein